MSDNNLPQDLGYKLLFSHPRLVEDLLKGFVQPAWLDAINLGTLEPFKTSFVTDDLRQRHDDCIWRVRFQDTWLYLYLLLEFQSSDDHFMANRIMTYLGLLYQDIIRSQQLTKGHRLPPVLPLVIYSGKRPWTAPVQMAELINPAHPALAGFTPRLNYFLLQENQVAEDYTQHHPNNLVGHLIQLGNCRSPQEMRQAIAQLHQQTHQPQYQEIRRIFAIWLGRMLKVKFKNHSIPEFQDLNEVDTMLSERIDDWMEEWKQEGLRQGKQEGLRQGIEQGIEQGIQEGRQEGRQQGEVLILKKLVQLKFGELPSWAEIKIVTADTEQLERWAERILNASSLNELLG